MRKMLNNEIGEMGIGAMIIFIAMVLVAGIAASVLIQTSTTLESQALATGRATTAEVAGGIAIVDVEGRVFVDLDGIAITVRARAGSPEIDLNESIIVLSQGTKKVVLQFDYVDATHFNTSVSTADGDVFGFNYTGLTNEEFGILVLEDADQSCTNSRFYPVINTGDKVMLFVNASACFGGTGIGERVEVFGHVYPEHGSPGVISFRTPSSYSDYIYDLQ